MIDPSDHRDQIEYHARRAAARCGSDLDDLRQDGWVGLLEAERRHDPGATATLSTFAGHRIRGQILDGIRRRHPFGPNASRTHADIPLVPLDAPGAPDPCYTPEPEEAIAAHERAQAVRAILDALPERYALILRLHYMDELTITEIAESWGMTLSNASRLHIEALARFRARWAKCGGG